MKKCNLCFDRTSQGLQPWCTQACPTQAIWYGTYEEFVNQRKGHAVDQTAFGTQHVRTRNYFVLPENETKLDLLALLKEARADLGRTEGKSEEAWVL